tara:strand:- start:354 stop:554 length:201 start_codon:yes stop_codon:yes gene_type:complete
MDDKPIPAPITIEAPQDAKKLNITVDFETLSEEPEIPQDDQNKLVKEACDKPWRVLYEVIPSFKGK